MVWSTTLSAIKKQFGWKDNAEWILTDKTQFVEPEPEGRKLQLVVGLDFGTAFTKVVVGGQRVRYAVPFAPYADKRNPFLLPSALSIVGDRQECVLGLPKGADRQIDDLKMRLLDGDFSVESRVLYAAYLTLVLRFVRGWLLNTHRTTYAGRPIVWLVNIGLPTDSYHNEKLVRIYRELLQVAWTVSVLPGPVSLTRIENYVGKGEINTSVLPAPIQKRLLDTTYIETFPEFAAQLVGYVRSPRRREGLHALLDVGAGTLDFTTFNVFRNKDGEDIFPIFARDVQHLGTRFLIEHRLSRKREAAGWTPSPYENVPPDTVFESKLSLRRGQLQQIDQPFRNKVGTLIRDKLSYARKKRAPLSRHWETGVPTFVCGGGSHVNCYQNVMRMFSGYQPPDKIIVNSLPVPEDLQAPKMPTGAYDRLSVAYGLSLNPYDIGRVYRMEETEDFTQKQANQGRAVDYRDRYLDRDIWT